MYIDTQDLIDRYGEEELERYAWDGATNQIDQGRVDRAISDAQQLINVYIAATVNLPLEETPGVIASICADIVRYRLQDDSPLDEARTRYIDALKLLTDISKGRAIIGTPEQPTTGATVDARRDDDDRLFTNETLSDFM